MAIQLDENHVKKDGVYYPVQSLRQAADLSTLKGLTPEDNEVAVVPQVGLFNYDISASDTADDVWIVEPTSGTGRWFLIAPHAWNPLGTILTATHVWDPTNIIDGTGETSVGITVTGAALGDFVLVGPPYSLQGMLMTAWVSAANTVTIRIQNETGSSIDLASGTWNIMVIQQP